MGRSWGEGSTTTAYALVGPEEAWILGERTDDGEGTTAAAIEGEEKGCGSTTGGGMGTITRGGVGTITEGGVGTKGGHGVGTITGGGVGTKGGRGVGTITGGGVASTIGTDGDGNGVGATPRGLTIRLHYVCQ